MSPMRIQVLLFASARDAAGASSIELDLPAGATVEDVRGALSSAFPALGPRLPHVRFAVDREFAAAGAALHEGAEVAVIPPVSGG